MKHNHTLYMCIRHVIWRGCGLMASVLNSESTGSITCMLCYQTRHLTPTVPLPTQVYNQVTANLMRGGNPAMDQHPNQRGVYLDILLVTSCYRNRDKFQPDRPLSLYADFAYLILNTSFLFYFYFHSELFIPQKLNMKDSLLYLFQDFLSISLVSLFSIMEVQQVYYT